MSIDNAIEIQQNGNPCTKFVVPSIGSSIHVGSFVKVFSAALSSAINLCAIILWYFVKSINYTNISSINISINSYLWFGYSCNKLSIIVFSTSLSYWVTKSWSFDFVDISFGLLKPFNKILKKKKLVLKKN